MDPVGIGPTPAQCECAVLPLNYGPESAIALSEVEVDPRGIEPLSTPCHGVILPIYHGPRI